MATCRQTMLVLILLVALFNLIAPLYLLDFIVADRDVFWDKGSAYAFRQPWWIGWPAVLAWIGTLIWILLEFPNRQSTETRLRVGMINEPTHLHQRSK